MRPRSDSDLATKWLALAYLAERGSAGQQVSRSASEVDDRSQAATRLHVVERGGQVVERSSRRDHPFEIEPPGSPQRQQPRELLMRIRRTEERTLHLLLRQRPRDDR